MILITKEKTLSSRDFENIKARVARELSDIPFHHFTAWYNSTDGIAHFKIHEKYRRVLERQLYIID